MNATTLKELRVETSPALTGLVDLCDVDLEADAGNEEIDWSGSQDLSTKVYPSSFLFRIF